jgi:hypothetical protein
MLVAADISDSISTDDLVFMDLLLAGWAQWASNDHGPSKPSAAGQVLRIASIRDGEYTLQLTDDKFTATEKRINCLAPRLVQIVHLEYRSYWDILRPPARRWLLTQEGKWRRLGLGYTAYGDRLASAKKSLFKPVSAFLRSEIETWRSRPKK